MLAATLVRVAHLIVILCLFAGRPLQAQEVPTTQSDSGDKHIGWSGLNGSAFGFELPRAIVGMDIDRYSTILVLSVEQRVYLDWIYESYLQQYASLEQETTPNLLRAVDPILELQGKPNAAFAHAAAYRALRNHEADFIDALKLIDERFFAQLTSILAEPQRLSLHRVMMHRQRSRCLTQLNDLKKARVDFSRSIEKARLSTEVMVDLEPLLWEYEQVATPLFVSVDEKLRNSKPLLTELSTRGRFGDTGEPLDAASAQSRERRRLAAEEVSNIRHDLGLAQLRIADLNDEFLPRFVERMPPSVADPFRMAYLSTAYRRVYPDPLDPQPFYDKITAIDQLDDELRAVMNQYWNEYRTKYDALCKEMCEETDRWQKHGVFVRSAEGGAKYNEKMGRWTQQRIELNESIMKRVLAMLPAEMADESKPTIGQWRSSLEMYRAMEARKTPRGIDFD